MHLPELLERMFAIRCSLTIYQTICVGTPQDNI
ncbi:Uncharacterised protein [Hafnia alvei]|uniref:Uncharacterized protein n=1 Tax=Hafnia alvei TaxID=569 RepID=A0A377PRB5_HAFAL|nr:Uncharacterised protein [Hafnia alvei]